MHLENFFKLKDCPLSRFNKMHIMKKLSRYIFTQLLFTVLSATVLLTSILWLAQSLKYIDFIANKGIPIILFCEMIVYLLPNLVVIVLPIAVLIGILFIYNKLITDHELVVMQASGLGYWQLAKPALLVSMLVAVAIYCFTSYLLPLSFRKYRDITVALREKSLISLLQVGQFNSIGNYTIYARSQDAHGNFYGILVYDGSEEGKFVWFMAEKGIIFNKDQGGRLQLINGNRQETDVNSGKPSILYFDRYVIEAADKSAKEDKGQRFLKAYERYTGDLLTPSESLPLKIKLEFIAAAHQRILSPLYALVFGLVGVCFMILGHFNRKGQGKRIVSACIVASLIELGAIVFLHELRYSTFMIYLSYGLVFLTMGICLILLTPWVKGLTNLSWPWRRRESI